MYKEISWGLLLPKLRHFYFFGTATAPSLLTPTPKLVRLLVADLRPSLGLSQRVAASQLLLFEYKLIFQIFLKNVTIN